MEAPGGRRGDDPVRTARAISARAWSVSSFGPEGASRRPEAPEAPSESPHAAPTGLGQAPRNRPTDATRSTAPHRPSGRQLDGLPCGGARTSMGVVLSAPADVT